MKKLIPYDYEPPNGIIAVPPPPNAPHYNVSAMFAYCEEKGIKMKELSKEERKKFELPKEWRRIPLEENQKVITLSHSWSLIVHEKCTVYSEHQSETNKFVILDWDNDVVLTFEVEEETFKVYQTSWAAHEVNAKKKVVTIFHEPEIEDDDEE